MKKLIIIFGYNNTRIYDVERLQALCKKSFDAEIMLCKEQITEPDIQMTSHCLQVDLEKNTSGHLLQQTKAIDEYILSKNLTVIACLPFADKGIPLGSFYAASKKLPHDNSEKALACIDKYYFRCLEKNANTPEWYKKPFFTKIHTLKEAETCIHNASETLFFKPVAEGNSRGCIEINSLEDLANNRDIVNKYLEQGIVIESCIKDCDEYSFDGVNGNYIITEKKTSQGYYRVETQHLLPAPLEKKWYDRLIQAGKLVSEISGSENGAVHNELFLNKKTGDVYCVEPNRRPAGLKLWDWISLAYPGVDNWKAWVDWATNQTSAKSLPNHQYYVGCRMLQSQISGIVHAIDNEKLSKIRTLDYVCDVAITKKIGQTITNQLKDNSDFIGYIVCKSPTAEKLNLLLTQVETQASEIYSIG